MFGTGSVNENLGEAPSAHDFNTLSQIPYHSMTDEYFGNNDDWRLQGVDNSYYASPFAQRFPLTPDPNSSQLGSPAPSAKGPTSTPNPQFKGTVPPQIEKRRAQNRNSQRAFRKRRASYINELEQELDEVRGKYKELLGCFLQMKNVVDSVAKDVWEGDLESLGRGTSALIKDEIMEIPKGR